MKITFLLTSADTIGGTEIATMTLAELLSQQHEVSILSVFRTQNEAFFTSESVSVRNLVDKRGAQRPVDGDPDLSAAYRRLAATPSELVRPEWEAAFNRLTDLELTEALRTIDTDVLISTTPPLMAYMAQLAPDHVLTVHLDHRVSELRGTSGEPLRLFTSHIDGLVSLTERTQDWFADTLGDCAPASPPSATPSRTASVRAPPWRPGPWSWAPGSRRRSRSRTPSAPSPPSPPTGRAGTCASSATVPGCAP